MKKTFRVRFFGSQSDNLKSKIQNRKLAGLLSIIVALAFVFGGVVAQAQQTGKIFHIGLLDRSTGGSAVYVDAFRQELSKLGWIEGKNITIEYRFAEQKNGRVPELAAELVRLKVDLIVTTGRVPALAAKSATTTIPIVMVSAVDPVSAGLVASLARPAGNVTGLSALSTELDTKRLEILRDAIPKLVRVGFLRLAGGNVPGDLVLKDLRPAAVALKLKLEEIGTHPTPKV
jgi:putative tryptophan/tyrosine transport system substrate-binding protein